MRLPRILAFLLPTTLLAQGPSPEQHVQGAFGLSLTNQYFFRGIVEENQGLIVQPWIELGYGLYEAESGSLRALDLTFGLWNSLHDGPTGAAGGIWYESAFSIDLGAELGDRWDLHTRYTAYTSPNKSPDGQSGPLPDIEELGFALGYDDKGVWFEEIQSGLQPTVELAFELGGQRDRRFDRGIWLGLGVRPSFALGETAGLPVTLAVPIRAGFSLGDYYEDPNGTDDDFLGYLDLGAEIEAPMSFLPPRLGPWTMNLGLHWLVLGDNQEERNGGDANELLVSFGMATRW